MGDWVHRTTKNYLRSVSPNDLPEPEPNYIANPDLTAVTQDPGPPVVLWPNYYWIITGDVISLEDQAGRDAIDAQRAADALTSAKDSEKARIEDASPERVLRAIVDTMIDEINTLRALHGLADRTLAQARTAIQNKIDEGI